MPLRRSVRRASSSSSLSSSIRRYGVGVDSVSDFESTTVPFNKSLGQQGVHLVVRGANYNTIPHLLGVVGLQNFPAPSAAWCGRVALDFRAHAPRGADGIVPEESWDRVPLFPRQARRRVWHPSDTRAHDTAGLLERFEAAAGELGRHLQPQARLLPGNECTLAGPATKTAPGCGSVSSGLEYPDSRGPAVQAHLGAHPFTHRHGISKISAPSVSAGELPPKEVQVPHAQARSIFS